MKINEKYSNSKRLVTRRLISPGNFHFSEIESIMSMVFIEVNTNYGRGIAQWERVRPTNGKPYQYNTYKEATEMLEKLYPEICMGKDRVRANGDSGYVYPTGKDFTKQYPGFPKGWECFLA